MKKSSNRYCIPILILCIALVPLIATAQTNEDLLKEWIADEDEALSALVLYPAQTRDYILQAAQYPEVLIKLESIQKHSSNAFKALVVEEPKATQEMLWDLTRYPGLIKQIVVANSQTEVEFKTVLNQYPAVIHDRAIHATENHLDDLIAINSLQESAEVAFMDLINNYPDSVKQVFDQLIGLPEVLTLLIENIRMTILVGDLYLQSPNWIESQLDSLHLEAARQHALELEDWKNQLQENPAIMEELENSALAYEKAYGSEDDYYDYDDSYYDYEVTVQQPSVVRHYHYHYSYWLGYPNWFVNPRWRPYPYWNEWGFYYGPRSQIVVIGLPSFHFTYWYFYEPRHHVYWSNLSAHFVGHYWRYRYYGSSISRGVMVWNKSNGSIISPRWLEYDGRLPQRFVEYGKYKSARIKYNTTNPRRQLSDVDYVLKHQNRYPSLASSVQSIQRKKTITGIPERKIKNPSQVPRQRKVKDQQKDKTKYISKEKVPRKTRLDPVRVVPQQKRTTVTRKPTLPSIDISKVKRGKEHHQNTWERSRVPITRPKNTRDKRSTIVNKKSTVSKPRSATRSSKKTPIANRKKKNNEL